EALFRRIQDLMGTMPFTYISQTSGATVAAAVAGHQGGVVASVNNPSEGLQLYQAKKMRPLCAFMPASPTTAVYASLPTCKAAVIVLVAPVAMFDARAAFSPSAGTAPGDVGARWYPFWAAGIMGVASVVVAYRALTTPQGDEGAFEGSRSLFAVLKLAVPMLIYAVLIAGIKWRTTDFTYTVLPSFGFYLSTALYMGLFAWWLGRYKIWWVGAIAVIFPIVIFAIFEIGFRVSLPKSFLYDSGILPF